MSAIERARQDIADGHYWLARQRVDSYLTSKGYDAELMNMLARICYEMRDAYSAGRFWITGTDEGEHVEAAIATFVRRQNGESTRIESKLHRSVKMAGIDSLPEATQRRLRDVNITALAWSPRPSVDREMGKLGCIIGIVFALWLIVAVGVGTCVIFVWLFNTLFAFR